MTKRRVVITGAGVVSALGIGRAEYVPALFENRSGIRRIEGFDPAGFDCQVGAEAPALKVNQYVPKWHRKATKLMSRDIELAVVAADAAVRDARLNTKAIDADKPSDLTPTRSGVNIGAGLICCDIPELGAAAVNAVVDGKFDYGKWGSEGMNTLTPLWLLKYLPNMLSCHVSILHDLQGPSNNITCGDASGLLAIGEAARYIAYGKADFMIAGAAECKLNPMALLRQSLLGRTCTRHNDHPEQACRPFDADAAGLIAGEGAGIVVLESLEHAHKRQAKIMAEVVGFGASFDRGGAFTALSDSAEGVQIALRKALADAQTSPEDVDMLIPHGLAVPENDQAEAEAIAAVFGAARPAVLATKSRVGNCGAGASAIDVATAVMLMGEQRICANLNCPHPNEALNLVTETQSTDIRRAVVSCYTFGGQTAALILTQAP